MKVKISDDGQILMNGPNVFVGYDQVGCLTFYAFQTAITHYIPQKDTEGTAKALISGYFYSGDQGALDHEGFLIMHGMLHMCYTPFSC